GSNTGRRDQAVEMLVTGTLGPSVGASVAAARLAAQAVRPSLPTELYEQVNALHWLVQDGRWQPDLYPFLTDVQLSIRLVDGLLLDAELPRSARVSAGVALESVTRIDGPGRRSRPRRALTRLESIFQSADTRWVAENARDFETQCRALLRQLEAAMRETYFH